MLNIVHYIFKLKIILKHLDRVVSRFSKFSNVLIYVSSHVSGFHLVQMIFSHAQTNALSFELCWFILSLRLCAFRVGKEIGCSVGMGARL